MRAAAEWRRTWRPTAGRVICGGGGSTDFLVDVLGYYV